MARRAFVSSSPAAPDRPVEVDGGVPPRVLHPAEPVHPDSRRLELDLHLPEHQTTSAPLQVAAASRSWSIGPGAVRVVGVDLHLRAVGFAALEPQAAEPSER